MPQIGICTKCNQEKIVIQHHTKGYEGEYKDYTLPYCLSCHKKIHNNARKSGRCTIPAKELEILSTRSSTRRSDNVIEIEKTTMMPNVRLQEMIHFNKNTGSFRCTTHFSTNGFGKKIYYIDI